jgi:hypothetical protein
MKLFYKITLGIFLLMVIFAAAETSIFGGVNSAGPSANGGSHF